MFGNARIAEAIVRTTMTNAIERFAIIGRSTTMPARVSREAISHSTDRNCWSNPSTSISNQVAPGPGSGVARKTKMMTAVPISMLRFAGSSSSISRYIRNRIIDIEPMKMISCASGTWLIPMVSVKMTNTRLPPRIHQLGWVSPAGANNSLSMAA